MDAFEAGKLALLRHAVAAIAYRGAKVLRGAPAGFGQSNAGPHTRTAIQILSHIGDVLEWAAQAADGVERRHASAPESWQDEVDRFFSALKALDERLSSPELLVARAEWLLQGPIADALTHVGQLATLRRLAGAGVRGEDYFRAKVTIGRVGPEQPPPVFEFD